jgi:hypothetical protein
VTVILVKALKQRLFEQREWSVSAKYLLFNIYFTPFGKKEREKEGGREKRRGREAITRVSRCLASR